eukprot:gb/GECG01016191.1/.p1 GENE.gb/GECG01016191.1/~~gb/GECG01016191.1/.p1  ORF type:complete len:1024 (+),score=120.05 gb/GECG01016191.1/:1-3072(+)
MAAKVMSHSQNGGPVKGAYSSAAGILALLEEPETQVKVHALRQLSQIIDTFWAEAAAYISIIESLHEDRNFPERELAALVASKCYYHLEEYSDALRFALGAGQYFNIDDKNEYTDKIVGQSIDEYTEIRQKEAEKRMREARSSDDPSVQVEEVELPAQGVADSRLENVISRVFSRCFSDRSYTQAIGIALQTMRIDMVKQSFTEAGGGRPDASEPSVAALLRHAFHLANKTVTSRSFRRQVLHALVGIYQEAQTPDWLAMCRCYERLGDHQSVARGLSTLLKQENSEDRLVAYQIAFDIVDNDNQHFLHEVSKQLDSPDSTTPANPDQGSDVSKRFSQMRKILSGSVTENIHLHFLFRHCEADELILKRLKKSIGDEKPNLILHEALLISNGYMNCGTTVDRFFRKNNKWVGKATHWAKFSATAHHGVVHKGHRDNAMNLLSSFLPQDESSAGVNNSVYVEGGALYALGLIHANRGTSREDGQDANVIQYLSNCLRNTQDEVIQHGACLGLGLAAMATGDDGAYALLRETLFQDSAVAGEASGLAIGLVLLGQGPSWVSGITGEAAIHELLSYAHDTQHEKTIRGISLGLAFVVYGMEEQAEPLIQQLYDDSDPILRYGCMYSIGMSYVGTGNKSAIRRLLHVAVSDVNDDVRRAAVTNLGFVLYRTPERVPSLVKLSSESFNPYVRYGACMAVGIACAGTGSHEAITMLRPLVNDTADIVKQGALLALSLVCQQQSESRVPEVKEVRSTLESTVDSKLRTTMVKMGAVLGHGIVDAGGRNSVVSLGSKAGFTRMPAVVGMAVWLQYWYWFPMMHFLSLSIQPTCLVGLNENLEMPQESFAMCHCRPSWFAYPEKLKEGKEDKKQRVATVELSTTSKAKVKKRGRGAASATQATDGGTQGKSVEVNQPQTQGKKDIEESNAKDGPEEEEKKKEEPTCYKLENPSRVTLVQQKFVTFSDAPSNKWTPVCKSSGLHMGVIVLRDNNPAEASAVQYIRAPRPGEDSEEGPEPDPPEAFEWVPPEHR